MAEGGEGTCKITIAWPLSTEIEETQLSSSRATKSQNLTSSEHPRASEGLILYVGNRVRRSHLPPYRGDQSKSGLTLLVEYSVIPPSQTTAVRGRPVDLLQLPPPEPAASPASSASVLSGALGNKQRCPASPDRKAGGADGNSGSGDGRDWIVRRSRSGFLFLSRAAAGVKCPSYISLAGLTSCIPGTVVFHQPPWPPILPSHPN